jgi:hypothetical protein
MIMDRKRIRSAKPTPHLTDAELFGLAIPAAGLPEALPAHLSDCLACTRALSEWKAAVEEMGDDAGELDRRSPEEWSLAEDRTLERVRNARPPRRILPLKWAVGIAASLLLVALTVPIRRSASHVRAAGNATDLTAQDQADDALLRDVARLSRGEDTGSSSSWSTLVPDGGPTTRDEDRL